MSLTADIILALRLADAAADAIRPWFRGNAKVERKQDFSPVTAADRAAEAVMRRIIERDRPSDGIIGEEYGIVPSRSGRLWVLDPIDGTRGFVAGRQLYGTLIALLENDKPILGIIDSGAAGDRWVGQVSGQIGTTLNGKPVRSRKCESLQQAHAATTAPHMFSASGHAAFQRIGRSVGDMLLGGDCHNYGLLAAGCLDLVMEEGLKVYDWAALVPVIEGAGGIITDWRGAALGLKSEGRVLAAGDRAVHAEALQRI